MDLKILLFQRFYLACSRQIRRIESIRRSVIFNHFSETLTGTSSIRAYRSQKKFIRDSDRYVDECQAAYFAQIGANRYIVVITKKDTCYYCMVSHDLCQYFIFHLAGIISQKLR